MTFQLKNTSIFLAALIVAIWDRLEKEKPKVAKAIAAAMFDLHAPIVETLRDCAEASPECWGEDASSMTRIIDLIATQVIATTHSESTLTSILTYLNKDLNVNHIAKALLDDGLTSEQVLAMRDMVLEDLDLPANHHAAVAAKALAPHHLGHAFPLIDPALADITPEEMEKLFSGEDANNEAAAS